MDVSTYYIRHTRTLAITDDTFKRLYDEHRIGIHYPEIAGWDTKVFPFADEDNRSTDPIDYPKGGQAQKLVRWLNELVKNGGFVCAEYSLKDNVPPVCRIGYVKPGSEIEILEGVWDPAVATKSTPTVSGKRIAALKTIKLDKFKDDLPAVVAAKLLLGRPRQGCFSRTHQLGNRVKTLLEGPTESPSCTSLSPTEQEVLCSEYLRTSHSPINLAHLLTPVGRTMRTFDILGIATDGKKVFGQVTAYEGTQSQTRAKAKSLLDESKGEDAHLVFFCRNTIKNDFDQIHFIDLEEVFQFMQRTQPSFVASLMDIQE